MTFIYMKIIMCCITLINYINAKTICRCCTNTDDNTNPNNADNNKNGDDNINNNTPSIPEHTKAPKKKNRCCPYNYDSKKCEQVDDRVLCGYDANKGGHPSQDQFRDLSDGCRLRGGRVECGYVAGPFSGIRRPSPDYSDQNHGNNDDLINGHDKDDDKNDPDNGNDQDIDDDPKTKNKLNDNKELDSKGKNAEADNDDDDDSDIKSFHERKKPLYEIETTPSSNSRFVTKCIEIDDRIVCQKIK